MRPWRIGGNIGYGSQVGDQRRIGRNCRIDGVVLDAVVRSPP